MATGDHQQLLDAVDTVRAKVDAVDAKINELNNVAGRYDERIRAVQRTLDDHERRIRTNEDVRLRWSGAVFIAGLLGGALGMRLYVDFDEPRSKQEVPASSPLTGS